MKPQNPASEVLEKPLADALGERYLSYALSTIMSRSLPDVRDGLKPVHRRLLFAMSQLRLEPTTPPKKSARVVGDVIGKFHPHGDTSVYDALVRLAQDFSVRYPLVDGQGNFGNIDGDNAAAMRYTEARLTEVAKALLEGIDEDAVDFRPTYDGDGDEPAVLPANFPNLLANGSSGIAVGMATNIPPHNVGEICDALRHLIKHRDASIETLVGFMPGPDFPTGGVLVESRQNVIEAYRTGRGAFRLRARWEVEKLGQGTWQIVVTEVPYQVQKARLVEKIAELLLAKKLILLDDVRDESAEDVRLVLVPKNRNVDPEVLMASLFQATDLEIRFSLNMNVLGADHVPRVMNLREVLQAFLDHRHEVLVRRSNHRLKQIDHRLEVLGGYLAAYLNLDEVIRIIREEDEPKQELIRAFTLTDVQADAILNMRLRNLRKLEEMEIRREHETLTKEKNGLLELLGDETLRWKRIAEGVAEIKKKFGSGALGKRRTDVADAPTVIEVPLDALVEREPVTVICSAKGWIRTVRGHLTDAEAEDVKYKDGDTRGFIERCETTDKLLVFASNGKFFTIGVDKLPRGRGFGEPVRLMIDLGNDVDIVDLFRHQPGRTLLVVSEDGRGFRVEEAEVLAQTRAGKQVLNLEDGKSARICQPATGDTLAIIGNNRKMLVFPLEQVPVMTRGKGVQLQKYKDASVADVKTFTLADGLSWKNGERNFVVTDLTGWMGDRAGQGKMPPNGFPKNNRFM
ncbi:topoisomerase-4 subunit A [Azospirillum lipoferum]|uniref:DNA topoisomerase 4 subunit A n=1 Tax=Azospirillum lipoferum TaxID=193 RepID=A0A5A9GXW5_AZOLI|nr:MULTISPECIES: DNA topoisomerase IV subunit A [Azospirillum]KAA0598535.1 DNA topoisomerase IV subunit A [Azospirillum lipoferum]MCP1609461.1 topoisomerase-4 subunit A [Azospirillum lipoferum]MDW5535230.1 DNA topoisomerase IV subunit A [Azospirillum sp. NL1]